MNFGIHYRFKTDKSVNRKLTQKDVNLLGDIAFLIDKLYTQTNGNYKLVEHIIRNMFEFGEEVNKDKKVDKWRKQENGINSINTKYPMD